MVNLKRVNLVKLQYCIFTLFYFDFQYLLQNGKPMNLNKHFSISVYCSLELNFSLVCLMFIIQQVHTWFTTKFNMAKFALGSECAWRIYLVECPWKDSLFFFFIMEAQFKIRKWKTLMFNWNTTITLPKLLSISPPSQDYFYFRKNSPQPFL